MRLLSPALGEGLETHTGSTGPLREVQSFPFTFCWALKPAVRLLSPALGGVGLETRTGSTGPHREVQSFPFAFWMGSETRFETN